MAEVRFGPALAGFPAFPLLPLDALGNFNALPPEVQAQILATFQALNFQFTDTSFSFELNSAIFGRPGDFDYGFTLTGDFSSLAANPAAVFAAFDPATAGNFLVRFSGAETRNLLTDTLAIAATADDIGDPLPFAVFFGTLLNPANYTQDLLAAFTGDLAQFDTLDLSAFAGGVISARPNGPTISRDGTISRPDGSFVDSEWGVVSFNGEVLSLAFSDVTGGGGDDVLGVVASARVSGGGGNDVLAGSSDEDALYGDGGRDVVVGGGGDDALYGGDGRDILVGGAGNDEVNGEGSSDRLVIGQGNDTASGGGGGDRFVILRDAGSVTTITDFDRVTDDLDLSALARSQSQLRFDLTEDGDLRLTVIGQSIVFQGAGIDAIASVRSAVIFGPPEYDEILVAAGGGSPLSGSDDADILIGQDGNDRLYGRSGNDTLVAGGGDDGLYAGTGSDVVLGGDGDDRLEGGDGDDVLDGGAGDDVLTGGKGYDVVSGGFGADVFVITRYDKQYDRISDFEVGQDRIDVAGLLGGQAVMAGNFGDYVRVTPLGPTELTGFVEVDVDGAAGPLGFRVVAQIDGAPFAIVGGVSVSVLGFGDFLFG